MLHIDATHLGRLMNCGGSRLLDQPELPENDDNTIRDEGNAFHWLAQGIFEGSINPDAAVGLQAYNGVFITSAMVDHAYNYLNTITPGQMEVRTTWGGANYQIDARADHISWNPDTLTLTVDDVKYGYRIVEPDNNWTLIAHAIGYIRYTGVQPNTVVFAIHQPRAYHPLGTHRYWTISYEQLCGFTAQIDHALGNPSDRLNTGNHCYKCPSMSVCPSYRMASMNAIDATSHAFTDDLSPLQLSAELDLLEYAATVIGNRKKAIEELALFKVSKGLVLPGRMIDKPKGQTRYKKNITPEMLIALTGRDLSEKKLPKVSALRDAGIAQLIIDSITERPEGAARLVKVDVNKLAQKKLKSGVK